MWEMVKEDCLGRERERDFEVIVEEFVTQESREGRLRSGGGEESKIVPAFNTQLLWAYSWKKNKLVHMRDGAQENLVPWGRSDHRLNGRGTNDVAS